MNLAHILKLGLISGCLSASPAVFAENLYQSGSFPALASDRIAGNIGDIVTVIVFENASATNSATSGSKKSNRIDGGISVGTVLNENANLGWSGSSDNAGSNGRSGRMVAQISATVTSLHPNGDLLISGEQLLNIDGERTRIRLEGRVRQADISGSNTILSSRLADARIEYDGKGFVSRSSRPGIVSRIFNWLGLL